MIGQHYFMANKSNNLARKIKKGLEVSLWQGKALAVIKADELLAHQNYHQGPQMGNICYIRSWVDTG